MRAFPRKTKIQYELKKENNITFSYSWNVSENLKGTRNKMRKKSYTLL